MPYRQYSVTICFNKSWSLTTSRSCGDIYLDAPCTAASAARPDLAPLVAEYRTFLFNCERCKILGSPRQGVKSAPRLAERARHNPLLGCPTPLPILRARRLLTGIPGTAFLSPESTVNHGGCVQPDADCRSHPSPTTYFLSPRAGGQSLHINQIPPIFVSKSGKRADLRCSSMSHSARYVVVSSHLQVTLIV
jgi:hypothetical protein